ncbi:MAG: proprotein convertase P-domain-containing protein [Vicinamibacteria bacterium]
MSKRTMRKALALTAAALAVVAGSVQLYAAVTVSSTNVPVAIPDNGSTTSTLAVNTTTVPGGVGFPTPWPMTDVNVTFNITHTWDDDVVVQIASPTIAAVTIMQNCGGSGDNFNNTTIDDAAAGPANCAFAGAPYAGTFQAMQGATPNPNATALAAFNGAPADGTWTLTVADDSSICTGTLNAWSITVNGPAPLPVELQNFEIK